MIHSSCVLCMDGVHQPAGSIRPIHPLFKLFMFQVTFCFPDHTGTCIIGFYSGMIGDDCGDCGLTLGTWHIHLSAPSGCDCEDTRFVSSQCLLLSKKTVSDGPFSHTQEEGLELSHSSQWWLGQGRCQLGFLVSLSAPWAGLQTLLDSSVSLSTS